MRNRNVSILSVAVLTAVLLFNFQNCAPATTVATQKVVDPEVRIIDDWSKAEIQFVNESVQIHDEAAAADVGGLCNRQHNGANIRWALWADDQSSRPLLIGDSLCKSGQFALQIDNLENVVCGIPHRLVVEGDWGATASVDFEKRCQPLASEAVAAPESSPIGTDCALEYVPASGSAKSCAQVCYREGKVVLDVVVDSSRCSSLVRKLASP